MRYISEAMLRHRDLADLDGDAFQLVLYSLALGLHAQLVYEWGVGQSTLAFLRAVQRTGGQVVSCDIDDTKALLVRELATDALEQWRFCCMTSEKMRELVTEPGDIILIDGCHVYSCVVEEVPMWWSLLKVDGLMLLHDTRSFADGPGKVLELCEARGLEVVELPVCNGIGIIHKRAGDPEHLLLEARL